MAKKIRYQIACGYCTTGQLGMRDRWDRAELAAAGWASVTNRANGEQYYACPRCADKLGPEVDHEMRTR